MQVSNDTTSVIDTDTAVCGIAGIEYRVLGIAHHYLLEQKMESINDGDVVIVDHDLENEELKLLIRQRNQQEKPEDYISCGKFIQSS